jgi:hypothetical protein
MWTERPLGNVAAAIRIGEPVSPAFAKLRRGRTHRAQPHLAVLTAERADKRSNNPEANPRV